MKKPTSRPLFPPTKMEAEGKYSRNYSNLESFLLVKQPPLVTRNVVEKLTWIHQIQHSSDDNCKER